MAGFTFTASGEHEDPAVHQSVLNRLKELFAEFRDLFGSSEFNSPHVQATNFHEPGTETPAPSTPPAGTADSEEASTDPGAGAPAG